jgi:hypothetical protein
MQITVNAWLEMNKGSARITELAHTMPRSFAQPLEQRRTILQDAVSLDFSISICLWHCMRPVTAVF